MTSPGETARTVADVPSCLRHQWAPRNWTNLDAWYTLKPSAPESALRVVSNASNVFHERTVLEDRGGWGIELTNVGFLDSSNQA